jgi:RNA polymerase sigma factor (sigma-70 family)
MGSVNESVPIGSAVRKPGCHIPATGGVSASVDADSQGALDLPARAEVFDFEAVFRAQYARVARVIARLVQDPSRAEEIAVEVFLRFHRSPRAHGPKAAAWLYRTAVRAGIDELRARQRREKYEPLGDRPSGPPSPEQACRNEERRARVRAVLGRLGVRQASLLILRSEGASYQEIAAALGLRASSVGTLLRRAGEAFRKEYVKRYGPER